MDESAATPLPVVLQRLRAEGYAIRSDRRQRLCEFGITTVRRGRTYFLENATADNLRFILEVERRFQLYRDRDGLAFELACLGYPVVPLERVHRAVAKRVRRVLSHVNRELRHFDNWSGVTFPARRIEHVAKKLAKHYASDAWIADNPKRVVLRDVLQLLFDMLIRASYLNEPFTERAVMKVLFLLGATETTDATSLAQNAVQMLELARPMLLIGEKNLFFVSVQDHPSTEEVRSTLAMMQGIAPLLEGISAKFNGPIALTLPTYPALPDIAELGARQTFALQAFTYACAHAMRMDPEAVERVQRWLRGEEPEIETAVDQLAGTRNLFMSLVKEQYGKQ